MKLLGRNYSFFQPSQCSALAKTYTVTIKVVNLCEKLRVANLLEAQLWFSADTDSIKTNFCGTGCLLLHGLVGVSLKGVSICCFNSLEYLTSNLNKRKVAVMFPYSDCLLTSVDVIV